MSITINPYLMLLVFIVFMITLYLLNIWLYRPLLTFMDNREASVKQDLQHIQDNTQEILEIEKEIKQILENARIQSSQIIEEATNEAKIAYEAKISKKKAESAVKIEEFFNELQVQKNDLKNQLLVKMEDFENSLKLKISQI
ncbi:FoF1 ATP synthase subunit B' [Helicobacter sp. 11S03491-1]|uniref:FoF1 ATP synthase subunit B' n=1 Tax=Helicobacter sp. 11S03491-1 TaxID=1476196 RepID=UPI000BA77B95|nr:FoF1 ATP synthase subunit B' [Helicobacter sp. 11S03491-1]PAF41859.1 F0F1 ATP synthase subunit B' [Helicobacter sp. 11S03491-1]